MDEVNNRPVHYDRTVSLAGDPDAVMGRVISDVAWYKLRAALTSVWNRNRIWNWHSGHPAVISKSVSNIINILLSLLPFY